MSVISLNPDWCIHSIYLFLFIYFITVIFKKVVLLITCTANEGLSAGTSKVILFHLINNQVIMNQKYVI